MKIALFLLVALANAQCVHKIPHLVGGPSTENLLPFDQSLRLTSAISSRNFRVSGFQACLTASGVFSSLQTQIKVTSEQTGETKTNMVFLGSSSLGDQCQVFNLYEDQYLSQLILYSNPNVGVTRAVPIRNDGFQQEWGTSLYTALDEMTVFYFSPDSEMLTGFFGNALINKPLF